MKGFQAAKPRDPALLHTFSLLHRGQPHVAACLSRDDIAEQFEPAGEFIARYIAGQPHTARSWSRTKCRRTIFGLFASSKWQCDSVANVGFEVPKIVAFGKYGFMKGADGKSALRRFFHDKDEFSHADSQNYGRIGVRVLAGVWVGSSWPPPRRRSA